MRYDYIDWLRNLAILFLLPYHTARIFDFEEPYYVTGDPNWVTTTLIHVSYWFMPLLFLLAGMSSYYGLRKRSTGRFITERVLRLLVPLIAGLVLIVPPQAYFAARFHNGADVSYLDFLGGYFTDWSDLSGYFGTFTPGQLWFIAFLFVISVALAPLMARLIRRGSSPRLLRHPALILVLFVGILLLSLLPDLSGKNLFLYAGYFFAGFLLATHDGIIALIAGRRRLYGMLAVAGMLGILVERYTIGWQSGYSLSGAAFTVLHFFVYWVTLLAILGYGRRYLNRPSRVMGYLNGGGYVIFIVHQTWIVVVGYLLLRVVDEPVLQYLSIVVLSLGASVGSYELIRRVHALRVLFGVKHPSPKANREPAGVSR
jgi:glucan biosynthesis protein C